MIPTTQLARYMSDEDFTELSTWAHSAGATLRFSSVEEGAASLVHTATAPELATHGGAYLVDNHASDDRASWTRDEAASAKLWDLSELVGEAV
jgi:hypothetical protein